MQSCRSTGGPRSPARKSTGGYTLMELMVVVAVVAIIASIALPAYQDYVKRGKIPEATAALGQGRVTLEQWFQDNRTYDGGPCPADTVNFTFNCAEDATTFTITATGRAGMVGFSYTLNEANARTSATPWGNGASCWITRKGDSC